MTVELYPYEAPDGVAMLIAWLAPLVAPGACRSERPTGALLPFIRVMRAPGADDGLTDKGKYALYVFGTDEVATKNLARQVRRRVLLLGPRYGGQEPVTTVSGTFYADKVLCESPRPMNYIGDTIPQTIYLYQSLCEMWLRIAAAT